METRLTIATIATAAPMGAEAYQAAIISRADQALRETSAGPWAMRHLTFRSLRSPLSGNRRLPLGFVGEASSRTRRVLGRAMYGSGAVTHRMNLELPPAPHGDLVTLHDVVAWRFPDESRPVTAAAEELRRADAVICVSHFSAQEAVELLGIANPHVVHNGVDDRFFDSPALDSSARNRIGIDAPYVLHAGGASRRKNLEALAEAWPSFRRERPRMQLVLAGPPHPTRTRLFEGMPGVMLTGRLADDDMPGLVAGAAAVVVPSLYEGFGLPALEAMAARAPVVAAATSSLPEVLGETGILVAPTAPGIVEGLLAATSGDSEVDRLVAAGRERAGGFTWEASARAHAAVWTSLTR